MSDADDRCDIEREYEEAGETARVYLRAVGVIDPRPVGTPEYREREERNMRDTILRPWTLDPVSSKDPFARHAASLGLQYFHCGRDAEYLDALLRKDRTHPAYRQALTILVRALRDSDAAVPEQLRQWEQDPGDVEGRWTWERTRDYLVGLTIDAMDTGRDIFVRHRDPVRGQLERDLNRIYAKTGNPPRIPTTDLVAALIVMKHRKWRNWKHGQGLTESDLRELLKQPSSGEIHAIKPDTEVRTSFPNLPVTRSHHSNKPKISICDAVAIVLEKAGQARSYHAVVSMYKRYKKELPVL